MNIQDLRNMMTGPATLTRLLVAIDTIFLHHTVSEKDAETMEQDIFKANGWHTGGYHEVILRNGDTQLCYHPNIITNGVRDWNHRAYHIAYVGTGNPTPAQIKAIEARLRNAMSEFRLPISAVKGHGEVANTACPGIDMARFRNEKLQNGQLHIVQKGDTISAIARSFGVTPSAIVHANSLDDPNLIKPGQVLNIPSGTLRFHTVQKGDTLSQLALDFNTTVPAIQKSNNIQDPNLIRVGQVIIIP